MVVSTCVEGPCKPHQFCSEGRAICPSPLYGVLLVALVKLTFRRVGFVHTKDLRREVAEPVDKRSNRQARNLGGFRTIGRNSSSCSLGAVSKACKNGVPQFCGIAPTKTTWTKRPFCRLIFLTEWEGGRILSTLSRMRHAR